MISHYSLRRLIQQCLRDAAIEQRVLAVRVIARTASELPDLVIPCSSTRVHAVGYVRGHPFPTRLLRAEQIRQNWRTQTLRVMSERFLDQPIVAEMEHLRREPAHSPIVNDDTRGASQHIDDVEVKIGNAL